VIPGKLEEFVGLFEETYHPAMSKAGARLVALWETVAISLPWPRTIALWEVDNLKHYAALAKDQYGSGELTSCFRAWREELGKVSAGGEGRILVPAAGGPTLKDLMKNGVSAEVCVHEILTTQPDRQRDYVDGIERLWMPYAVRNGRRWIGTYSTSWKNCEAVSIWALEKGWDTLAEHYSRDPTGDVELKTWMSIAIALRERYEDGLLHALPPTPLK
jgi:hypothetical protein